MNKPTDFLNTESDAVATSMFSVSEDDALLLKHVIDSKGQLKLYHPVTQRVLLDALKKGLVTALKEEEKRVAKKEEERKAGRVKNAAAVAKEMTEDND